MAKRTEILMAGAGGQGLVFLASVIAQAAMRAGMNVVQTQSYGIAQRGGFIAAEVVADEDEILFQQVMNPDIIIVLNEVVGSRYDAATAPVLYDSSLLPAREGRDTWHGIPFTRIAEDLGSARSANMVAVGALAVFLPFIDARFFEETATKSTAPASPGITAMRKGMAAAEQLLGKG